jgi:hypothetical protein
LAGNGQAGTARPPSCGDRGHHIRPDRSYSLGRLGAVRLQARRWRFASSTIIVRSSMLIFWESLAWRRMSARAFKACRSGWPIRWCSSASRISSSSFGTERGCFERDKGAVVADRYELHARETLEHVERCHDDDGVFAVTRQFCRMPRERTRWAFTSQSRNDRLPQVRIDCAEMRDGIFRQRHCHRPRWPSELARTAWPSLHEVHGRTAGILSQSGVCPPITPR